MNGIHDMGGIHGLGPIENEPDEPVFHAPWEARVFALNRALGAWRKWNIDASRHQRELIPGADYLRMSYYEKWLTGLVELTVKSGLATADEIATGKPSNAATVMTPALPAHQVAAMVARGGSTRRETQIPPRFTVGQAVRARNMNPTGHTRLPRYARGKAGIIERDHGSFVFPDSNAHFLGERPQHVYSVRFTLRDLWGEEAVAGRSVNDAVYLDLWDDYLESA